MLPDMAAYMAGVNKPITNKCLRRAEWHDYRSKCIYMLTLMKAEGIPPFSSLSGGVEDGKVKAVVRNTRLGHHIGRAMRSMTSHYVETRLLQYVIMPDHVHMLVEVMKPVEYHLSQVVKFFKAECAGRYREILQMDYDFKFDGTVFAKGYNDRILMRQGQLQVLFDYMRDNPRRLYLRRSFPQYFCNGLLCIPTCSGGFDHGEVSSVMNVSCGRNTPADGNDIESERFSVYGNMLLLENPYKVIVRFSRKFREEKLAADKRSWKEAIRSGGVLVSPFIHPVEKEFLHMALAEGGKVIMICENGFPPRWKPSRGYIQALTEGRLLFVGPEDYTASKIELTRQLSMAMNARAEQIAAMSAGSYRLRRK